MTKDDQKLWAQIMQSLELQRDTWEILDDPTALAPTPIEACLRALRKIQQS